MSLVTMSGEFARLSLPKVERDLVIRTRQGVWVEVVLDE